MKQKNIQVVKEVILYSSATVSLNALQIIILIIGVYNGQVTLGTFLTEFALFIINLWWYVGAALAALLTWLDWLIVGASVLGNIIGGAVLKVASLVTAFSLATFIFWETMSDIFDPDPYASVWVG